VKSHSGGKMIASQDKQLREHLLYVLSGGGAHATFEQAVGNFPVKMRGEKVSDLPYTAWMLLEHMRLAQWDILEFSRNANHVSPKWPEGYWPTSEAPPKASAWNDSVQRFREDLGAMQALVNSPETDLYVRIPWGEGQTILREALLIADHNAYHLGQLITLRRLLGIWKD
jgi:hypothetical protein